MAKKKKGKDNKSKFKYKKPEVAGLRLCVWCPGGMRYDNVPITKPWLVVYAPVWVEGHRIHSIAPSLSDGHTKMAVDEEFLTPEAATLAMQQFMGEDTSLEFIWYE